LPELPKLRKVKIEKLLCRQFGEQNNFGDFWQSRKGLSYARDRNVTVRRLQRAELLDHQEQEDHHGSA
jgi:hypothetical protein